MMEGLALLVRLQELDGSIRKLESTRTQLARERDDAQRDVEAARRTFHLGTEAARSMRATVDKRDGDLRQIEAAIKKLSTQLNTIKTNKEYAAIQHEILGAKANQSKLEDEVLAMMDEIESRQRTIRELEAKAKNAEAELAKRKEAIAKAIADAGARISRLQKEREQLVRTIPAGLLQPYERLAKGTYGQALSACRNFICARCRMSLTANTVNLLMAANKLIFCQSCGRILYLPEDEDTRGGEGAGRK